MGIILFFCRLFLFPRSLSRSPFSSADLLSGGRVCVKMRHRTEDCEKDRSIKLRIRPTRLSSIDDNRRFFYGLVGRDRAKLSALG